MPLSQPTPAANAVKQDLPANIAKALRPARPKHNYGSIDPKLKAVIRLVMPDGSPVVASPEIVGIMTDGDLEIASQYSTPFENSNPEQKLPTLLGMVQSGQFVASMGSVVQNARNSGTLPGFLIDTAASGIGLIGQLTGMSEIATDLGKKIESLQGKSNLTKLNSTQIFVSTGSIGLSCTIFFRAWADAAREVEENVSLLQEWALPSELYANGLLESFSKGFKLEQLFPSTTPPFVSLTYGGQTFAPMILESVNAPLVVERDQNGNRLAVSVQCQFVSRQAWDAKDVRHLYRDTLKI